jgi:DNA-binding NarL/FixJ family response regulator
MHGAPIRILTVDDHSMIRDGVAFAIQKQSDMCVVAEASTGREAIQLFRKHQPDVTLMDLRIPDISGTEAIEAIRREFPRAHVLVLTTYSGDVLAARALKAGAEGYLLKHMLRTDLIDAIRALNSGRRWIPKEIATDIAEHINADWLTDREIQVLQCVSAGNSNKIVGSALGISEDTVKGHVKSILSKLGANDRTHAVSIALKRGFLDE